MPDQNIVVAFGGISPEHEVSVLSAMQVISVLEETEYRVTPLYITKSGSWLTGPALLDLKNYEDLDELKENAIRCSFSHNEIGKPIVLETEKKGFFSSPGQHRIDALIPAFHGSEGENGSFQGVCEMYNIPYAGSGVFASSIGMDKIKAKELCKAHDIPVVDGFNFFEKNWEEEQDSILNKAEELGFPVIVKPAALGSSIGVNKAENREELIETVETAFRYDHNLMVERAISPLTEINCSVLGFGDDLQTSVCEQPLGKDETLSFEDKYQRGEGSSKGMASADRIIPADIPEKMTRKIQELSLDIFRTFRASGVARLDFLVNSDRNKIFFNEINTIPGSFSFYLWEETGMSFESLILRLIEIAKQKHQSKISRIRSYETNLLSQKAVQGIKGLKGNSDDKDS